jgi:hypothetical protein
MGNHGFLPLPQGTPVFWVTSPTRERASYGFAINGAFEPDVGRVQIAANSQKNAEIAQSMSQALAARLGALWKLAKADWPAFRLRLDLTDIQPYEFWESLWEVCGARFAELCPASDETTVAQLAREILWPTQARGLRLFYSDCATLPTGLEGDYRVLTRLNQLRFIADGVLEDKTIFTRVAGWPQFQKRITPGAICSRRAVSRKLAALKLPCEEWEIIRLAGVAAWILGEAKLVDPEQAQQLGEVITPEFKGSLIKGGNRSEYDELVAALRECKFLAEDGSWHAPEELLLAASLASPEPNSDEDLRAAFAPRQHRLNAAYAQAAISFFRTCRDRFDADAEKLVCWIWAAERAETRVASLRYLLHPRAYFRTEVSERLRNRLTAEQATGVRQSWLWKVESYEWWVTDFAEQERSEIVAHLLRLSELTAPPAPPPPPPPPPPDMVLKNIYKWWTEEANCEALIRSYEMRLYPYGRRPQLDTDPERLRRDTSTRKQWLILWLLGAFHTIGRTRDQQHRNFLELCEEHGWLDVFSAAQSVFPEEPQSLAW